MPTRGLELEPIKRIQGLFKCSEIAFLGPCISPFALDIGLLTFPLLDTHDLHAFFPMATRKLRFVLHVAWDRRKHELPPPPLSLFFSSEDHMMTISKGVGVVRSGPWLGKLWRGTLQA